MNAQIHNKVLTSLKVTGTCGKLVKRLNFTLLSVEGILLHSAWFIVFFLPTFVVHPLTLGIAPRGHSLIEDSSHNKID